MSVGWFCALFELRDLFWRIPRKGGVIWRLWPEDGDFSPWSPTCVVERGSGNQPHQ